MAQNNGTISMCYATGTVAGTDVVGGLVGSNQGTISMCYATGNVEATEDSSRTGGLVGYNNGPISACYATGTANVLGTGGVAGGLVGQNVNSGSIRACYAKGAATATGASNVGGLVGYNVGGTINKSYFDTSTSGINGGTGAQSTSALVTPTMYDDSQDSRQRQQYLRNLERGRGWRCWERVILGTLGRRVANILC